MSAYYNDNETFPCRVIQANQLRGRLPLGRVHHADIRNVEPTDLAGYAQIHLFAGIGAAAYACRLAGIPGTFRVGTCGFPCPDLSLAGKGAGIFGSQSGLFWHALALLELVGPRWLVLENVPGLRTRGIELVLAALEIAGYSTFAPLVVGAWAAGAPHRRDRVWIVALRTDIALANAHCLIWGSEPQHSSRSTEWTWHQPGGSGPAVEDAEGRGTRAVSTRQRPEGERASNAHRSGFELDDTHGMRTVATGELSFSPRRSTAWGSGAELGHAACIDGQIDGAGPATQTGANRRPSASLAHSDSKRFQAGYPPLSISEGYAALERGSMRHWAHWPAGFGQPQFEWECPRTLEPGMGRSVDGITKRLVRHLKHRRPALKGLGNAWVPQTAVPILKWIYQTDQQLQTQ